MKILCILFILISITFLSAWALHAKYIWIHFTAKIGQNTSEFQFKKNKIYQIKNLDLWIFKHKKFITSPLSNNSKSNIIISIKIFKYITHFTKARHGSVKTLNIHSFPRSNNSVFKSTRPKKKTNDTTPCNYSRRILSFQYTSTFRFACKYLFRVGAT